MKTIYALAAVLAVGAVLSDYGIARSATRSQSILAGVASPARYADAESNGPSSGGRDTAQYAEGESSGPSPRGHDSALG